MATISDIDLINQLCKGSEEAFTSLYTKYARKVYHVSKKMGLGHEDAEGIVQEVFIKVWRIRTSLDSSLSFNAYLLSITKSVVIKHFKKKARRVAYQQYALTHFISKTSNTEDYIIFSELDELSTKMINKLPARQKQVFMMKNFEHLTTDEIARELNISKRTIENQIYRATKWLKERLV